MTNRRQFVILAGPTATGKTKLAIQLTQFFHLALISADSRQIYQQANIVTGKDHPSDHYLSCLDLLSPDQPSSIALWFDCARQAALHAWQHHQLPLFVGGTGFYLKALTSNIETMTIPPNPSLRHQLNQLSLTQLQHRLQLLNLQRFQQLNQSDKVNPRRLIRAIEIVLYRQQHPLSSSPDNPFLSASFLFFILQPPSNYRQFIRQRVVARLEAGAIQETQALLSQFGSRAPALQGIGYPLIIQYLQHQINRSQLIEAWVQAEYAYARRQLVWFKKQPFTHWLSADSPRLVSQVVKAIKNWYHEKV